MYMYLRFAIILGIIIGILFIVYKTLPQFRFQRSPTISNTITITNSPTNDIVQETVTFVYDGDTVQISDGTHVRLIGIDAPEIAHDTSVPQCFATESAKLLKELILGQKISIGGDKQKQDVYGRMLAYVWADDVFINDFMVRQGYAKAMPIKPDVMYASQLRQAENEAKKAGRGLWHQCNGPK